MKPSNSISHDISIKPNGSVGENPLKKACKSKETATPPFPCEKLTWDDLSQWTDSRSLERGRSYQRRGAVRNLNLLPDGGCWPMLRKLIVMRLVFRWRDKVVT